MNVAIQYVPEAYTTKGQQLMGRNSAGESFLEGYFRYSKSTLFLLRLRKQHMRSSLQLPQVNMEGASRLKKFGWRRWALREPGTLFHPDRALQTWQGKGVSMVRRYGASVE